MEFTRVGHYGFVTMCIREGEEVLYAPGHKQEVGRSRASESVFHVTYKIDPAFAVVLRDEKVVHAYLFNGEHETELVDFLSDRESYY